MKIARIALFLGVAACWPAAAQVFDFSGNGLLNGTYYFREVVYVVGDGAADLSDAYAMYGGITFDGKGHYTVSSMVNEAASGTIPQAYSTTGTYSISASGYGFLSSPIAKGDAVYGLVSQGIFIGSSTETANQYNDFFVAAPIPSNGSSVFQGTYSIAYMNPNPLAGSSTATYDAMFQMTPNGSTNIGTVNFTAYSGGSGSTPITLSESGVTYSFSSNAAVVKFPTSSNNVISGQEYVYISPDGNFIFGGSPNSWDMFVGVKTGSGATNFGGLYYQAGIDEDDSQLASGVASLDTFFGSFSANAGAIVGHQRLLSASASSAFDFTYSGGYTPSSNASYTDQSTQTQYVFGNGGALRIGLGIGPFLGIDVAVLAPTFSGPGVYINPTGVLNAASSAPFTAALAPGELITIYGTNLAPSTKVAASVPFPTTLNGVQVLINNVAAPIYYVSATQVSAIVPYSITTKVAQVQVQNNGAGSNAITEFVGLTAPGVFTVPPGGLGYGAMLHQDFTLVTAAKPAQAGETVAVYLTGLGTVFPSILDGAVGPSSTLSQASNSITAYVGAAPATVTYAGLAPGLAGLYQINVTVPAGVSAGDNPLEIVGPDSDAAEALIPVGGVASAAVMAPQSRPASAAARHREPRHSLNTQTFLRLR